MSKSNKLSRRSFLQNSAVATGAASAYFVPSKVLGRQGNVGANDKIQVALIGAGGMGRGNLKNCANHPDVVVTGICDVWKSRRDQTVAEFPTAKGYNDYRELLEQKNVDAVIIATPPHWHCLQAVDACRAGKDIYLQKPMTMHVGESLAVKEAVDKYQRVSQVGTQIHASENYRRVVELVRAGRLGKVSVARTFNVMNQGPEGIGKPPVSEPPAGLDWEMWVGPASPIPFNPLVVRSAFENCSFMRDSGGWTPGMAPHIIDLPHWALDLGIPTVTNCCGGRYTIQDIGDSPDTQEVTWQYPGFTMTWSMSMVNSFGFDFGRGTPARRLGIYFHGVDGTLFTNYSKHEIVPEGDRLKTTEPPADKLPPSPGHEREWLDCIRSRKQPSCHVGYHYKIDLAINLANLSMNVGRSLRFDSPSHSIVDDAEATRLAVPEYRGPWKFPAQV